MSDQQEILLTKEGLARLESELEMLKTQKRREVAERIKAARELGDISENSEYDDAKNEQAFIEGRIAALEKTLRRARVVSMDEADAGVVVLGSRVRVRDLELGEEMEYRVVGSAEADPTENRISNESPVGKALMGQRAGTVVTVKVPDGTIQLEILERFERVTMDRPGREPGRSSEGVPATSDMIRRQDGDSELLRLDEHRLAKLESLRARGVEPYGGAFAAHPPDRRTRD